VPKKLGKKNLDLKKIEQVNKIVFRVKGNLNSFFRVKVN